MNKQEAIKLLALIKVAYPTAYKDMDQASKQATVNMWASSFTDMPYPIMEQAFNHFRMVSKFPPTVAEMVDELKYLYHRALEGALSCKAIGMEETAQKYWAVMEITARYKDGRDLGGLNIGSLQGLLSGGEQYERLGTPGGYQSLENRLPIVDES